VSRGQIVTGILSVLCTMCGSCSALESAEPQTALTRVRGAVWVLPPGHEFPTSDGGHLNPEIGVTPRLWELDRRSGGMARLGIETSLYRAGRLEGLALYAGLGVAGPELGLWCLWRAGLGQPDSGLFVSVPPDGRAVH
jgi:hypothetical protein